MGIVVLGIDLGKNSCSLVGLDGSGRVVLRRRMRRAARSSGLSAACHGASWRWRRAAERTISGGVRGAGPRGSADVAGIRAPLREGTEERRPRCRGDRGSGDATDDALCSGEERGTVRRAGAASGPRAAGGGADGADQSSARAVAGTRDHRPPGARQAGDAVVHLRRRGRQRAEPAHPASGRGPAPRMADARRADRRLRYGVRWPWRAKTRLPDG